MKLASEFDWSCSLALSCSVRSSPRAMIASMSSSSSSPPFELKTREGGGQQNGAAAWGGASGREDWKGGRYTFELKTASAPKRIMPSISSFDSDFDCSTRREAEGRRQRGGDG